jgi:carboxypeptidase Q
MNKPKGMMFLTLAITLMALSCSGPESDQPILTAELPLHLEEHLNDARIDGSEVPNDLPAPVEWNFDEPQPGWKAVGPLFSEEGAVRLETTEDALRIHFSEEANRTKNSKMINGGVYIDLPNWQREDWLEVLVRARNSDEFLRCNLDYNLGERMQPGTNLRSGILYAGDRTRIISDGEVHTYRLSIDVHQQNWGKWENPWRQFILSFVAPEPASIDLLSVSAIPKDYLYKPTGVLTEERDQIKKDAIFTHAPGRIEYRIKIPYAGSLDVGLGVLREASPVTFRVNGSTMGDDETTLFEEICADENGWVQHIIDLSIFSGKTVKLSLETDAEQPGSIAFWVKPTINGIKEEYKPKTFPGQEEEPVDIDVTTRIIKEAFQRSQVMGLAGILTDVHGPRLTGSPSFMKAGEWAAKTLNEWGLSNVRLQSWGPYRPGWTNERFYAHVISPVPYPLIGYPLAWSPGTDGWITGEAAIMRIENDEDLERYRGKLRGKFILTDPPPQALKPSFERTHSGRWSDKELKQTSEDGLLPWEHWPEEWRVASFMSLVFSNREFLRDEGIAGWIGYEWGEGGVVKVSGLSRHFLNLPPLVCLIVEHYGRIWRNLERGIPVKLEMNIQNRLYEEGVESFNVLAEIQGSEKADEKVVIGAHLDSWHAGTGAIDNAAGVAVMMEALRILNTLDLKMKRTVQLGLWGGHEVGYFGSEAYMEKQLKSENEKVSAYYNLDHGPGRIRGVHLLGNNKAAPILARWMEPFHYLGMTTLSPGEAWGSDHMQFHMAGIPSFFFIQDPLYEWAHHSNMDTFERLIEEELQRSAAIVASFVYHTANRNEMLPRIKK